ncbi:TPA: hypothetical protein IFC83_000310 [Escherichia coli]|nr:hypothetical protein [Escherichia coli]
MARVVFRDARIYLIQWLTKIRHILSQRQSLNTDKEHLRKMVRGMFWLMLLIISAKMAYSLWRYFSFSAEYTAVSSSVNKPLRADAKPFDKNDVQLVSQQNWFGKYQPVAAPVKQPESAPVAETRLNVVLRGIAFGARPGVVIEEGGKQQVYLQGERLGSHNAVIEEINRDHVMLRYQGKMERLSLAEEERPPVAVISENGATTINPDTNGDLSTLAQLLSGFSGTAVGVVKGDWMALVQAVKNDSSSNVLSTPSITTLDNQEAFFMVGQDVPVLTGSTVGSNNSNPFNTVERKKVGIMLKVTPQINEGNAVQMVIEQEVSKVEGQTSLDVVFGERKLKTTVLANDGELIVLGGLMDDQAGESVAKVPLLGDIPVIGNLFKSTADKKEKRNLMVFIRPTILRDGMAADGVSQRKYNYMRAEQIYRDEQGLSLMPHTAQPILPAQNQALPPEVRAFLNAGRTR